jgi:hypothetical protein
MGDDRRVMYEGWRSDGAHSKEWGVIAKAFLNQAFSGADRVVKCPCSKCCNYRYQSKEDVEYHICKFGFMPGYLVWYEHGEAKHDVEFDNSEDNDRMDEMLNDLGRGFEVNSEGQPAPEEVNKFYRLLATSDEKLHEFTDMTVLQTVTRLMSMKSKYNFSNKCYNDFVKLLTEVLPPNHKMPKDMYQSKKMLAGLGLEYEKIDVCEQNCMLFWKDHKDLTHCRCCNKSRYVEVVNEEGEKVTTKVADK